MKVKRILITVLAAVLISACEKNPYGPTNHTPGQKDPEQEKPATITKGKYAEGADISWVTQMEKDGMKFYTADGKETECTSLMKSIGFDAIRLRVWVDPEDGWCGKEDVLVKAKRAQHLGMRIMIDFHYSDTWADPSSQKTPEAWKSFSLQELATALEAHTKEVLQLLKSNDIDVEWVQVGNETNSGMLHPLGKISNNADNFAVLANKGYDAIKSIYPEAKVIIHRSEGHKANECKWLFNHLKNSKVKYDIIGLSLYPVWWENNGWCDWKPNVDACLANIKSLVATFGKPVMICEIGMPVWEPQMSKEAVQYILDKTKKIEECHGAFYWEPQTDGVWKPSGYVSLGWNAYDKGAFKNGKPTAALDPFKD
jgi:arabinogalactan endo-1,4-beta-galactosidase